MDNLEVSDSLANKNNSVVSMHQCENCSACFDAKWKLERHKQNKKGCKKPNVLQQDIESNKCLRCNKTFSNKYNLARHQKKICINNTENEVTSISNSTRVNGNNNSSTMVDDIVKNVSSGNNDMVKMIGNIIMQHNNMLNDHKAFVSNMINVLHQYAGDYAQHQSPLQ